MIILKLVETSFVDLEIGFSAFRRPQFRTDQLGDEFGNILLKTLNMTYFVTTLVLSDQEFIQ